MKYNVKVIIKQVVNLTIDADNEETASELVDGELHNAYDIDANYEIKSITRVED